MKIITLYVSDHCESCEKVLHYFKEKDFPYEVINVAYDQLMFDRMLSEGALQRLLLCWMDKFFMCLTGIKLRLF
ncbi:glutaredoxin domain-containing protein [Bacillus massiliglaciei]|uniref:glutaredoxin domain-containing protein n=1 Tax=Bacillus massiliglaciei TaxID=1816693 RepID=UPI0018FE36FA